MKESTAESIAHPVAFGAAMLVMFINWMVLGPPAGAWAWVEHLVADASVLALMAGVGIATSCVRSEWWSLLRREPRSAVNRAAALVRDTVNETERPHRAAAHGAGFVGAAAAFAFTGDLTDRPLLMLAAVLGTFVGAQAGVMLLLRPRADAAMRRALSGASAGLSDSEQARLREELGVDS